jgi:hypothetical protein
MSDPYEYEEEARYEQFVDGLLDEIAREPAFRYLATHGDAVEERVLRCIREADALRAAGFAGAALARASTAIEIIVRFFLVRPLLAGAFLSDDWAEVVLDHVLPAGPRGVTVARDLLGAVLRNWKIDLAALRCADGTPVWDAIRKSDGLLDQRNRYVHAGADAEDAAAARAVECARVLLGSAVDPLAARLGFTRGETGMWSVVLSPHDRSLNPPVHYERRDPLAR